MDKFAENLSLFLLDSIKNLISENNGEYFWTDFDDKLREKICKEADEQHFGTLLYFYLNGKNLLPPHWENKFASDFRAFSARELKRANDLHNLIVLLNENQIMAIPLKGAALAYACYPHPALRTMSDFDILIKVDDIDKTWDLMLDNKFKSNDLKTAHHMPMLLSPTGQAVELHSHICSKISFPAEIIWSEIYLTSFLDCKVTLLSPELNILHIINHALHDNLIGGFKPFVDILFIIDRMSPDPEKLRNLAIKMDWESKLIFFVNIFPDFLPERHHIETNGDIEAELNNARFLLLNAKQLQQIDKKFLMLSRDYLKIKGIKKYLFILKKCIKSKKVIEYKYKRQMNYVVFIYYYYKEIFKQFSKLISFEKNIAPNEFIQDAASAQKNIQAYFANSEKSVLSKDR